MTKLSNDLRTSFGRLLVLLLLQQTQDNTINPFIAFSQTLIWFTNAGLKVDNNEKHKKDMDEAKNLHIQALQVTQITGRLYWVQSEVKRLVFEVANIVLPIAIGEGILELNEASFNIIEQFGGGGKFGGDRPA